MERGGSGESKSGKLLSWSEGCNEVCDIDRDEVEGRSSLRRSQEIRRTIMIERKREEMRDRETERQTQREGQRKI